MADPKSPETLTYHAKHVDKLVFVHAWRTGFQELVFATNAQAEAWAQANDLEFRPRGRAKKAGGTECSRPVEISDDCNYCHVSDAPYDEAAGCYLCEGCAREGQGDTDYDDQATEALKAAEGERKP